MRLIISRIISNLKDEEFILDSRVPLRYIFYIICSRILMAVRGYLKFKDFSQVSFVGSNVKIRCATLIKKKKNLSISRNVFIDALSTDGIKFGKNVSIGMNTTIKCSGSIKDIGKGLIVGDNVGMGTHGFWGCAGGIEIGSDCIFGNFVSLHSENHNFQNLEIPIRLQGINRLGIKIGKNCWIGAKVTFLDGVIVNDGCIIAAGSVVSRGTYESNSIIGGVPARVLKKR